MKEKLLLHCCCAPCSLPIIEHLHNYFDITLYAYNPCITDWTEYCKRMGEVLKLPEIFPDVKLVRGDYVPEKFMRMAEGLEDAPERGIRCLQCYKQRLCSAAEYAEINDFKLFSTTLTLSPYKNIYAINRIGMAIANKYNKLSYFCSDFRYLYPR